MQAHPLSRENLPRIVAGQEFIASGNTYVIQGKLGDGAIGVVRNVIEKDTKTRRVIKILAPESSYIESASFDDIHARFRREGQRGKKLSHEHLVDIYAFEDNIDGANFLSPNQEGLKPAAPFIVMEHGGRRTLESYIRKDKEVPRKALNFSKEALTIALYICDAVAYLHRHKHVHRDIKPANIFLTKTSPPSVRLGDFGIVKWSDIRSSVASGTLTVTGQSRLGTMKYMPPEQSTDPKQVTVKSDIWSLGITLWELFTNQILADYHYVYQLREVRMQRSTTFGRMHKLGFGSSITAYPRYEALMERILDCFLGYSSRPTSRALVTLIRTVRENALGTD